MHPAVEIVPYKRNIGTSFFHSEYDLIFLPKLSCLLKADS